MVQPPTRKGFRKHSGNASAGSTTAAFFPVRRRFIADERGPGGQGTGLILMCYLPESICHGQKMRPSVHALSRDGGCAEPVTGRLAEDALADDLASGRDQRMWRIRLVTIESNVSYHKCDPRMCGQRAGE